MFAKMFANLLSTLTDCGLKIRPEFVVAELVDETALSNTGISNENDLEQSFRCARVYIDVLKNNKHSCKQCINKISANAAVVSLWPNKTVDEVKNSAPRLEE